MFYLYAYHVESVSGIKVGYGKDPANRMAQYLGHHGIEADPKTLYVWKFPTKGTALDAETEAHEGLGLGIAHQQKRGMKTTFWQELFDLDGMPYEKAISRVSQIVGKPAIRYEWDENDLDAFMDCYQPTFVASKKKRLLKELQWARMKDFPILEQEFGLRMLFENADKAGHRTALQTYLEKKEAAYQEMLLEPYNKNAVKQAYASLNKDELKKVHATLSEKDLENIRYSIPKHEREEFDAYSNAAKRNQETDNTDDWMVHLPKALSAIVLMIGMIVVLAWFSG